VFAGVNFYYIFVFEQQRSWKVANAFLQSGKRRCHERRCWRMSTPGTKGNTSKFDDVVMLNLLICPHQRNSSKKLVNGVFSWAVGTFDVVVDLRSGKQKLPKFVSDFDFANCVFNFKFSSERPLQIFWVSESFVKAWLRSDCNVNINIFFFSR